MMMLNMSLMGFFFFFVSLLLHPSVSPLRARQLKEANVTLVTQAINYPSSTFLFVGLLKLADITLSHPVRKQLTLSSRLTLLSLIQHDGDKQVGVARSGTLAVFILLPIAE